ncbi:hypothetical protein CP556_14850 [Natrinema sp. CBA1119]|nr:hypothetical protein CP556_14850 [Natrinema sp. CBA1119]
MYTEAIRRHPNAQYRDSETQNVRDTLLNCCGVSVKITPSPPTGDRRTVVWPRHRPVMPTGLQTRKYPKSAVRCRGKPRRLRRGGGHTPVDGPIY